MSKPRQEDGCIETLKKENERLKRQINRLRKNNEKLRSQEVMEEILEFSQPEITCPVCNGYNFKAFSTPNDRLILTCLDCKK